MAPLPSRQDDLATLAGAGRDDEVVARAARILAAHFASSAKAPKSGPLAESADLVAAVARCFPTPFAEEFARWAATSGASLQDDERAFASAFDALQEMWRQLGSFLPFIFMTTLNRIRFGRLDAATKRLLGAAIADYRAFYLVEQQRQKEATRFDLLKTLLALFRRLDRGPELAEAFVLAPLARQAGGFDKLIPERFEAQLELVQWVRNQVVHHSLGRRPWPILDALARLLQAAFLDVVAILRPICEAYQLVYVEPGTPAAPGGALRGSAFSGAAPPTPLLLNPPRDAADADRIEAGALYLIRRGAEAAAEIAPADCLNLTPFLIYQQGLAASQQASAQPLFVFRRLQNEPRRNRRSAWFEQFSARSALTVDAEVRSELGKLLEAIERFQLDLDRIGVAPEPAADPRARISERTWAISLPHLGLVADASRYAPDGTADPAAAPDAIRRTFLEELFVAPPEAAAAEQFLLGADRGLVVTGASGAGKSNLLCHLFLTARRAFRPALFLAGRQFTTADAEGYLRQVLVHGIHPDWRWEELSAAVANGPMLLLVIDGVNEYSGPGGAQALIAGLIDFVGNRFLLPRVQVILGCRQESWDRFIDARTANPLDAAVFRAGAPLRLSALEGEAAPAALYDRYRAWFALQPEHWADLSAPARQLMRLPLMLALVAETYARAGPIPADLDYFRLFASFTERKFEAARDLVPPQARTEFDERMERALYGFAAELFALLGDPATRRQSAGGAALSMSVIDQSPRLADARVPVTPDGVAPLWAAVAVGLLEQTLVRERTFTGRERVGRMLHFSHDQYAQYWLGKVCRVEVLAPAEAARDPAQREKLAPAIAALASSPSPLLTGALTHWLREGLRLPPATAEDLLLPLLEALSGEQSPAARYWVRGFFATLLRSGIVAPEALFPLVLRSERLAPLAAELFLEAWRDLSPPTLSALLQSPALSDAVLVRLADVFFQIFSAAPEPACAWLDAALRSLKLRNLAGWAGYAAELRFTFDFAHRALLASFGHPERSGPLSRLLLGKYKPIVKLAVALSADRKGGKRGIGARSLSLVFSFIDPLFAMMWRKYIGDMVLGGNEKFLEPDNGVVQRDLVRDLVPAMIAMHNGELRPDALAPGTALHALLLRMMRFRVNSIAGYYATLVASVACRADRGAREALIDALIAAPTDSGRFFAGLLIAHSTYLDAGQTAAALDTLRQKILPWYAADGFDWEHPACFALCATASDLRQWPACWDVLRAIMADIDARRPGTAAVLGDHLLKASFLGDGTLGQVLLRAMLEDGMAERPEWRPAVLKVAAGLLSRSPGVLAETLRAEPELAQETPTWLTPALLKERDRYSGQVDWDRAIVTSLAGNRRFSFLLIRDVVGGLVQARTLADFVPAARRCLLNGLGAIYGDLPDSYYARLTVADVLGGLTLHRG